MPKVTVTIEGLELNVQEHVYPLAYLARMFHVGSNEPKAQHLSIDLDDCYRWLDNRLVDRGYGDIVVYDISWVATRGPIKIKTLSSRPKAG